MILEASDVLRSGGLVAFPTETVYGLGADATNSTAVEKVFKAKGRPPDNPLIVHVGDINQLRAISKILTPNAMKLAEAFWPGPLTLVVEHRNLFPPIVTAHLPTVALRMPDHPVALALIKALGTGLVGPSANLSGRPSPTTARHVVDDLDGIVDVILDAGPTTIGVESTVVDVTTDSAVILRLGGLPREKIEAMVGHVRMASELKELQHSPGTRHRHYAPNARVELVPENDHSVFAAKLSTLVGARLRVGCMIHSESLFHVAREMDVEVVQISAEEYASKLFYMMRKFDADGVAVIMIEKIPEIGIGEAVMDRLRRAAER